MKKIILLFIISFSATAGFYSAPVTEIEKKLLDCNYPITVYKKCAGECAEITKDFNCNYSELADEMVNDLTKPIKACEGLDAILDFIGYDENGCKITGYEQKLSGRKIVVENAIKKTAYEFDKLTEQTQEAAIEMAMKAIDHGKRVIALLVVRNAPKGLTTAQVGQMNSTYAEIKGLLETGSLVTAKEKIELITPDGTIVTEGDKTALVSEINKFLGL